MDWCSLNTSGGKLEMSMPTQGRKHMSIYIRKRSGEKGITGIETAIILIAFVIVASVFAYVVLTAGLFSTQKAKEVIHSGLDEAQSTIEVKGNIYGEMVGGILDKVYLTVATTMNGDQVDFTDTSNNTNLVNISYADNYQIFSSVNWTMTMINAGNSDNLLDKNELFLITIDLGCVNAGAATPEERPSAYHKFTLEIKPPTGAVVILERTIPAKVDSIVSLD
jgi:archaeal flagellin FlaB